jgi:iron(III) transport system permease protein
MRSGDLREAALTPRRLGLLARGVWVALLAAALAQVLGAALAMGLLAGGRGRIAGFCMWVALFVLLTPPYLYAYAWSLPLLPSGISVAAAQSTPWPAWVTQQGRAVGCLAAWLSPLAAILISIGWRTSGAPAYRMALLDAAAPSALFRAAVPVIWPWIAASALATGTLALTEYSVCHLCQVLTWNTEVLAEAQLLQRPGRALLLAWPLVLLCLLLIAALWLLRRPLGAHREQLAHMTGLRGELERAIVRTPAAVVGATVAAIVLFLPWLLLAASVRDFRALAETWRVYPNEWPGGLVYAAAAGVLSLLVALGVDALLAMPRGARGVATDLRRTVGWLIMIAATIGATAPPALVGDAIKAAYADVPAIANDWPIVAVATTARFALIAIVALRAAGSLSDPDLRACAAIDGASAWSYLLRIRWRLCAVTLAAAGVAVAVLSLTEIPATLLVQPRWFHCVAITLLNQIHYGRNDEIIAMSLYVGLVVAAVVSVARVVQRRILTR